MRLIDRDIQRQQMRQEVPLFDADGRPVRLSNGRRLTKEQLARLVEEEMSKLQRRPYRPDGTAVIGSATDVLTD
jgi:hypothetical protein